MKVFTKYSFILLVAARALNTSVFGMQEENIEDEIQKMSEELFLAVQDYYCDVIKVKNLIADAKRLIPPGNSPQFYLFINVGDGEHTALMFAVGHDNFEVGQALIAAAQERLDDECFYLFITASSFRCPPPLMKAIFTNKRKPAQVLIVAAQNRLNDEQFYQFIIQGSKIGSVALVFATQLNNIKIVQVLIAAAQKRLKSERFARIIDAKGRIGSALYYAKRGSDECLGIVLALEWAIEWNNFKIEPIMQSRNTASRIRVAQLLAIVNKIAEDLNWEMEVDAVQ